MKVLVFHHPQMVGENATVIDASDEGWSFEGNRIVRVGIIGPDYIKQEMVKLFNRRRVFDSNLIQRMALYELSETKWTMLFSVENRTGVFYLNRVPGKRVVLIYQPVNEGDAIIAAHRSEKLKLIRGVHDANAALVQYMKREAFRKTTYYDH
jgi:hypothetical protein